MFESDLAAVEKGAGRLVADLEIDCLSADDAATLLRRLERVARVLAGAKLKLAARVADSARWRDGGHRSAAHWLAAQTGSSIRRADDLLDTAARLRALPVVDAALRDGLLSADQAVEIAAAATADPSTEGELLHAASRSSLRELQERCRAVRAAALPDPDARYRAIRQQRYLRHGTDVEGAFWLRLRTTADDGAHIAAGIESWQNAIFDRARAEGRREPVEAYAADALVAMARASLDGPTEGATRPAPVKVIVRVDHAALVRGQVAAGETCEIAGIGPIPVSVAATMADDAFLAAVVTKGHDVATVAHLGRRATAWQRTALEWRDVACCALGCGSGARLEIDHRTGWAETHTTCVDDLDRLCGFHHMLKTRQGWRLEPGVGKRRFLPPDHPDPP